MTKIYKKSSTAFLIFILVAVPAAQSSCAIPIFAKSPSIQTTDDLSVGGSLAIDADNVYFAFLNTDFTGGVLPGIVFQRSLDKGVTFSSPVSLESDTGFQSNIAVTSSGNNIYVTWLNLDQLEISTSTNNGASFNDFNGNVPNTINTIATNILDDSSYLPYAIAASSNDVYLLWIDSTNSNNLVFASSTDKGQTFTQIVIPRSDQVSAPRLAVSGNNVYVAWKEGITQDIHLKYTTDHGATFNQGCTSDTINLSNSPTVISRYPSIAASGTNLFIVWQEGLTGSGDEINFAKFDSGSCSVTNPLNLSHNSGDSQHPRIFAMGNNIVVVWEDSNFPGITDNDILLTASFDGGIIFNANTGGITGLPGTPLNISADSGKSNFPKIVGSTTDIYVIWEDDTRTGSSGKDVFFKPFIYPGYVGGLKNISNQTNANVYEPKIDRSTSTVSVAYPMNPAGPFNTFVKSSATNGVDLTFDRTQYQIHDTGTIALKTNSGMGQQLVSLSVDGGTTVTNTVALNEIGTTGIYSGNFNVIDITSNPMDVLTAIESGGQYTNAFIQAESQIDFVPSFSRYDYGDIAHLKVIDPAANSNPSAYDTITVKITSTKNPAGIQLKLGETGINSGIFGNTTNNKLIFVTGSNGFKIGDKITINQKLSSQSPSVETISEKIVSTSDPIGISLTLTETSGSSGEFSGILALAGNSGTNTIKVSDGDIVRAIYGSTVSNFLVSSSPTVGAIQVFPDDVGDTVIVSYPGAIQKTASIEKQYYPGGGAGGLARAGFVVNALAGFSKGTGSSGSSPIVNSASLLIGEQTKNTIPTDLTSSVTKTVKTGEKLVLSLSITANEGIDYLTHAELGLNNKGDQKVASDTSIVYEKFNPNPISIVDPHGLFKDATFKILPKDARSGILQYDITFAKPMEKSDVRLLAWDVKRNFVQQIYDDAIKVDGQDITPQKQDKITSPNLPIEKPLPQKLQKQKNEKTTDNTKQMYDKLKTKNVLKKDIKKNKIEKLQKQADKNKLMIKKDTKKISTNSKTKTALSKSK